MYTLASATQQKRFRRVLGAYFGAYQSRSIYVLLRFAFTGNAFQLTEAIGFLLSAKLNAD
jgi:hypothetical protein